MECFDFWSSCNDLARPQATETDTVAPSPLRHSPRRPPPGRATASPAEGAALPALAAHERERSLPQSAPAIVRGRNKAERKTAESKVSVESRIAQFPANSFTMSLGKLHCAACKVTVFNKWSSIQTHVKSDDHKAKLLLWETRSVADRELKANLLAYYEEHPDESGHSVEGDVLVFRFRTLEAFLKAGIAPSVIDMLRPLLQRSGIALTDSSHLRSLIPRVEESECKLLNSELVDQYVGIAFDGTTRLGEAINVTGRWTSKDFRIVKRLLDITTLEQHVTHSFLASHISDITGRQRGIPNNMIINTARDSVAVNGAACRLLLTATYTSAADTLCFCHTLCHVGEHFELVVLDEFMTPMLELACGRNPHAGAKLLYKQTVGVENTAGYSNVRWYAKAEIEMGMGRAGMNLLGNFISECEQRNYGEATTKKLRSIYDNKTARLRLELAAMLDMQILVKTTYDLEGDRLEILLTYDRVEALRTLGRAIKAKQDGVLPNVDATLRRMMVLKKDVLVEKYYAGHGVCTAKLLKTEKVASTLYPGKQVDAWKVRYTSDGMEEHLEEEELRLGKDGPAPAGGADGKPVLVVRNLPERDAICDALSPGFDYLENRITGNCQDNYSLVAMYELCRVVRIFDPNFASMHASPASVDELSAIKPLLALGFIPRLKAELPLFLSAAANAPTFDRADIAAYTEGVLTWWRTNGSGFKQWALAARIVFAISPNSASCERVFSLLKLMFGEQQISTLADAIRAALMLRYNDRMVG